MQKHVNLVDLVKSFPTNIYLQNLASIQPRTSLLKFDLIFTYLPRPEIYFSHRYHALYGYCLVGKELLSHHHGLVRGGTLFKRLEDELSPDFQMNIAQIMAHLDRQGTAHRDLKAMHVVLDANNRCKVISD